MQLIGGARPKLLGVQVLRALAALMVAMHHAQYDAATVAARSGASFAYSDLLPWPAGVDVFFVISGFIMVYASADLFGRRDGPRIFMERRIARILPLYWMVTSLFLAIALLMPGAINSSRPMASHIVASYLFLPATGPDGAVQPVYSLGWTLNYEMFFYVLFAAAIVLERKRAVIAVAVALGFAVACGRTLSLPQPLAFWSEPIVVEFVLGMALGLLRGRGTSLNLPVRVALFLAGLLLLHLDPAGSGEALNLSRVFAYGLPAALLVTAVAFGSDEERPFPGEAALAALGDASYALYLVHPFAIRVLREIFLSTGLNLVTGPWVFVTLALIGALAASLVVYRLFERPMTRSLRRLFAARRRAAAPAAARHGSSNT